MSARRRTLLVNTLSAIVKNQVDTEWTYFSGQEGREDRLRWKTLIGDEESNHSGADIRNNGNAPRHFCGCAFSC